ncbi:hypothetical protein D3C85_1498840 [compost metagenome]
MAEIADMEVEPERRARRGAQHGDGVAPMVAARLAHRMGMEGRQSREITRGDRGRSGAAGEGPGKLGPEGGFKAQILACDDEAGVRENGPSLGQMVGQGGRAVAVDQDRGLMLAHDEAVADEVVERVRQAGDL